MQANETSGPPDESRVAAARSGRRPSIRRIVAITMIVPVVTLTIVLVLLAALTGRRAAERAAAGAMENLTIRVGGQAALFLGQAERLSDYTAALVADGIFPIDDPVAAQQTFVEQLRAFPAVSVAIFARFSPAGPGAPMAGERVSAIGAIRDPDGIVTLVVRDGEAVERRAGDEPRGAETNGAGVDGAVSPAERPRRRYAIDLTTRPWFIEAQQLDEAAFDDPIGAAPRAGWTEPYAFVRRGVEGFDLGVSYVRVVRRADGTAVGVLAVDVTFDALGTFLRNETAEGVVVLVADPFRLVASSRGGVFADEGVQRWLDPALQGVVRNGLDGRASVIRTTIEGAPSLAAVAPLPLDATREWVVVAALPESLVFAEANRSTLWMVILSAVALASAIGGLLWLGERVAAPIQALQAHVRRLGEGDFSEELDLRASRELEALSHGLNAMGVALKERVALQQSMAFARQVQQALLPQTDFARPGLALLGHSEFCDSTGGDYFDFFELPGRDAVLVAVGDVMGHGVASAILMATARAALRSEARRTESLGAMLLRVGNVLLESRGHGRFMTMFLLLVEPAKRRIRWANAGHESGLLITPEGAVPLVLGGGDLPLGIDAGVVYLESVMEDVPPGSLFYLGTDGVTETADADHDAFGTIRLNQFLRDISKRPLPEVRDALLATLTAPRGNQRVRDDHRLGGGRVGWLGRVCDPPSSDSTAAPVPRRRTQGRESARVTDGGGRV